MKKLNKLLKEFYKQKIVKPFPKQFNGNIVITPLGYITSPKLNRKINKLKIKF